MVGFDQATIARVKAQKRRNNARLFLAQQYAAGEEES